MIVSIILIASGIWLIYRQGLSSGAVIGYAVASAERDKETLARIKDSNNGRDFYILGNYRPASDILNAGDAMKFKNGIMIGGGITINSEGTKENPIIVESYGKNIQT